MLGEAGSPCQSVRNSDVPEACATPGAALPSASLKFR